MPEGVSLHLGLNRLNPSHYTGFDEQLDRELGLRGSETDAIQLEAITSAQGFTASTLLGEAATAEAVAAAVREASARLDEGDLFVVTFSGYGGGVPDLNSDEYWRERTWALYDRQMPEDELMSLVSSFRPNVRVLIIDDSSEQGTVRRDMTFLLGLAAPLEDEPRDKALPPDVAVATYDGNRALYDGIQSSCAPSDRAVIPAAVLVMTGFREGQRGTDGRQNGVFTEALLRVWDGGRFDGNYKELVRRVAAQMPPTQTPRLIERGSGKPFVRQRALSI